MSAFLPQHDAKPQQRTKQLAETRTKYEYCYDYVSPLALVKKVPAGPTTWNVVTTFSDYRRVTVRIKTTDAELQTRTLAELIRVFANVPPVP